MSAFLYGKLPAHGDFVSRGLTTQDRDALDAWLTASLAAAREDDSAAAADAYEHAPPWRFAWSDGVHWSAGALASSVDAVGRRFPILLGRAAITADLVEATAQLIEALLYDALAESWDADRLHTAADTVVPTRGSAWQGGESWWTLGAERFTEGRLAGARPAGLLAAMLTMGRDE